jgi:hypothetical protein
VEVSMVLGFDVLKQRKWRKGREQYGETFVGNPITELLDELADGTNYCEEIARQELLLAEDCNEIDNMLRAVVLRLAEAVARKREFDAGAPA